MTKKNKDQELLVVSKFFEEAGDVEKRYKALKKTIKNIKKFNEAQIKGKVAEA
ncbi:MAG: hypothetical protein US68_C0008G0055 [Candidatus Shapirobacteria bacterium GW2011_GWE1_38_10]|uniref:Uncharacterized protein n=1 Tax=Candidatus Shapirobacteria bacterium GW2011_GWE1_38_10 TaxID=1618488 RepID=A0A0G0IGR0_9BACT|nr:MAG: hypothetical protein US46_C0006G0090 [Candidatus Shapirobacteria bacterium GW2011_GWF2_37_20]KKQ50170.1 MAG: hypothetical protein US68_C0008G0055 [Candidatus Shapirobacteria bacterium GW2011_GWE1_38_10]KKQ64763.1 MAG: hypothetical protein US85_C0004G0033 [Candidatus Shapirobacteria bacterium GW2011_GWF1_38_23]